MKTLLYIALVTTSLATSSLAADPRLDSWFTTHAGKYARTYTNDAARNAGNAGTTWGNGTHNQILPAYCGVQEIYSSANWVYVRSTGLGSHIMGPWYLNAAHTTLFPGLPKNQKALYRIPRTPAVPATKTRTGLGAIGYFVDGVAMFDSRDGFVWTGSAEAGNGTGYWNREAYVNESVTFDPGYAHQENSGTYHYHANPIALRYLLGDHVDYAPATKTYAESTGPVTKHSPILGWVCDGFPVYGPYGYAVSNNAASGVRRMLSGFQLRNGSRGTDNLATAGRSTIPQWAVRAYNVASAQSGPAVSTSYPLGRYMEDNAFLGDLGYTMGPDYDLDDYNGRWCVTPEFPGGTYAYFVAIAADSTPVFPYNIGRTFYGTPSGAAATLAEAVTTNFLGEASAPQSLATPSVAGGTITLTWSATEGGTYRVESTTNFTSWSTNATNIATSGNRAGFTNNATAGNGFYRVVRTALANYDAISGGGGTGANVNAPGGTVLRGGTHTATITLPTTPPQPPANVVPTSITLAGTIGGTSISRPTQGTVQATFVIPAGAATGAQNIVVTFTPGPTYTLTGALTIN